MKKFLIILGVILVVIVTSAVVLANSDITKRKPSDYKIGITYQQAIKSDKPMVTLFYVDWCGYCLRFMPNFRLINNLYNKNYNFVMLNAEDPQYKKLIEDVALTGFPTMYIIDPKYNNRILLNNAIYNNIPKLRIELDRYIRIRSLLK